jgi:hypothetical protein
MWQLRTNLDSEVATNWITPHIDCELNYEHFASITKWLEWCHNSEKLMVSLHGQSTAAPFDVMIVFQLYGFHCEISIARLFRSPIALIPTLPPPFTIGKRFFEVDLCYDRTKADACQKCRTSPAE